MAAGSLAQQDQVFRNMYWSGTQPDAPVPVNVQHFKTFDGEPQTLALALLALGATVVVEATRRRSRLTLA